MKCCNISVGDLRHRVTIQRKENAPDGTGGSITTWVTLAQPWAKLTPKTGTEKIYLNRLNAQNMMSVVIRYNASYDFKDTDKLLFKGNQYQIRSIINIEERDKYIELLVEKGVAQ